MVQSSFWEANRATATQEISPHIMLPEGSLPHSQESATCPYPKTDRFSPCFPWKLSKIHFNIILPSTPRSSSYFRPSGFPTGTLYAPLLSSYVLYFLPISVFLTWSPEWYLVSSTEHKAHCYVVFSTPLFPLKKLIQLIIFLLSHLLGQ
jgi:hypothetical protein